MFCVCSQFCWPCHSHNVTVLYNASWRQEETCSSYLPRGPRSQWYDAKAETSSNSLPQENIHPDLGSECQGDSPAVAINKRTQSYNSSDGSAVVLFKCLFLDSTGKSPGQLCGCLLCEGLWQLVHIPSCWKTKHHVFQEEFPSTIIPFPWTIDSVFFFSSYSEKITWKLLHHVVCPAPVLTACPVFIHTEWG